MGSFFGALVCRTDNVPEGDHYSEEQADQQTPWIGPREIPDGITDDRTTKKPPEKIRKNPVTAAIVRIGPGSLGKVTLFFALLGGCKPLFQRIDPRVLLDWFPCGFVVAHALLL